MNPPKQKSLSAILNDIEQRANAATPTPWIARDTFGSRGVFLIEGDASPGFGMHVAETCELIDVKWAEQTSNALFIAAARSDVPALVKALRLACETIGEMSDVFCGLNDMTGRNALFEITSVLNGNAAGALPVNQDSPSPAPPALSVAQRLIQQMRDSIEAGENHDSDNPDPPTAEHDCFCVRCCAIRFLDAHNASVAQEDGES